MSRDLETCPACGEESYTSYASRQPEDPSEGHCGKCGFQYSSMYPGGPLIQGQQFKEYMDGMTERLHPVME